MKLAPASLSLLLLLSPAAAYAGTCDAALFGDGVCDCGCGSTDPDCPQGTFTVCERSHCGAGQVPWEHAPASCMSSACGDGWNDPARGEVCDDGNAIASGGCSSDCKTVSAGYTCGEVAKGCKLAPVDAGTEVDAGTAGAGSSPETPDAGTDSADAGTEPPVTNPGGCAAAGGASLTWAALGWLVSRRRASSR